MTTTPLTDWSLENREQHMRQVVRGGWSRIPPQMMSLLLMGLTAEDHPLTREEVQPFIHSTANPDGDLAGSCWDDGSDRDDEELALLRTQQADAVRYATHYGLPPLETLGDILTLLITAGVVHEIPDPAGRMRLHPAQPFPQPQDVFPLDEAELAVQRHLHLDAAYSSDSYRIIDMFDPSNGRREEITTSLDRLARAIDGHAHDARQAVQLLLHDKDFTASVDVATVAPHKVFRLCCDWEKFDATRIGIHGFTEDGRLSVTLPDDLDAPS
jgi:hypothetical protein